MAGVNAVARDVFIPGWLKLKEEHKKVRQLETKLRTMTAVLNEKEESPFKLKIEPDNP